MRAGISIDDIIKAILCGGDVSIYTKIWHKILGISLFPHIASLGEVVELPRSVLSLKDNHEGLSTLVGNWEKREELPFSSGADVDITLISLAPYGQRSLAPCVAS